VAKALRVQISSSIGLSIIFKIVLFYLYYINQIMKNNSILIIPIRSYSNADTQKKLIYLDNKNKSGIYR
jgi:hypothetical protein